jgi:dolichol-phosphate mannosyltransferase
MKTTERRKDTEDALISVVIPCLNESGNIRKIYGGIREALASRRYELIFVDDGSTDDTLDLLKSLAGEDPGVRYLSFSRNFGHQNALKAGLDVASGDCVISLDADGQHPPFIIPQMIAKWQEGYDIVYTSRNDKENISTFNRVTSKIFYKILNIFSEIRIDPGSADFRLLDRKVVDVLKEMPEHDPFLRGIIKWVGFRQTVISFVPEKRFAGKTRYSLSRKIRFAASGITSFSTKPLKVSIYTGFIFAFSAFLYGLYAIYETLFTDNTITGWTSLIVSILFIGGIQLIMIGILGEYLGKLFVENKRRPNYIVRETNIDLNNKS